MLIILEGPDGAGKTHLAQRLEQRIKQLRGLDMADVTYIHKKAPTAETFFAEYLNPIKNYLPNIGRTLILDRWHIGELLYPEMTERQTLATAPSFAYLEMFLQSRGAIVIHVDTDPALIFQSLEERPAPDALENRVLEQHAGFSRALKSTRLRTYRYDRTQDTGDTVLLDIMIATAAEAELDTPHVSMNPTYVGSTRPAYVLVGDERNIRRGAIEYPTAFVPESATSGTFLLEALPKHWLRFGTFGLLNANEGYPIDIFRKSTEHEVFVPPRFVVLGREAEKTIRAGGELDAYGFAVVPHPQFIRRFHHHARDRYGREIQRVAMSGEDSGSWRP